MPTWPKSPRPSSTLLSRRRARHKPLSWRMILVRGRSNAVYGVRTRHEGACALFAGLVTGRRQAGARHVRRRPANLGRRGAAAGRDRAPARPGRTVGALHRGSAGARAGAAWVGRDDSLSGAADRRRLRGCQRLRGPAHRPGVQDGSRPAARGRGRAVLAAHHVPAGDLRWSFAASLPCAIGVKPPEWKCPSVGIASTPSA